MTTYLTHLRVQLALHELRPGRGRPLLLLHGLGERSSVHRLDTVDAWPGPIVGLDFTGHGASTVPVGGGYSCEALMGDADAAIGHLGPVTILGRGLGAYIALLVAGARAADVCGTILTDGPGLTGGGSGPQLHPPSWVPTGPRRAPDPHALTELSRDVRPADYATQFTRLATSMSPLEFPVTIAAVTRPTWLRAVGDEHGVVTGTVTEAIERYREAT